MTIQPSLTIKQAADAYLGERLEAFCGFVRSMVELAAKTLKLTDMFKAHVQRQCGRLNLDQRCKLIIFGVPFMTQNAAAEAFGITAMALSYWVNHDVVPKRYQRKYRFRSEGKAERQALHRKLSGR